MDKAVGVGLLKIGQFLWTSHVYHPFNEKLYRKNGKKNFSEEN